MKLVLLLSVLFSFNSNLLYAQQAPARAVEERPPFKVAEQMYELTWYLDGREEELVYNVMQALTDEGKVELALQKIYYRASQEKVEVLSASSTTDKSISIIKKAVIKDEAVVSAEAKGLSDLRQITIPFENLKVGSQVSYRYKKTKLKSSIKNVNSMMFSYGAGVPEKKSAFKIKSQVPLFFQTNDFTSQLAVKMSKEKDWFVMEGVNRQEIYKIPYSRVKMGPLSEQEMALVPRVHVSVLRSWSDFNKNVLSEYNKLFSADLPKEAKLFLNSLSSLKTQADKVSSVRKWMKDNFTYSGRWTSAGSDWVPRSLQQITKTKVGDCKDFALLFTKMLRELRVEADVTLVDADSSAFPVNKVRPLPLTSYFDHAIVRVVLDGKELFLDPTTSFLQAQYSDAHLHSKYAFILSNSAQKELFKIKVEPVQSSVKTAIKKEVEGFFADSSFELNGPIADFIVEIKNKYGEKKALEGLALIAGYNEPKQMSVRRFEVNDKTSKVNVELSFLTTKEFKIDKEHIKFKSNVAVPLISWLQMAKVMPEGINFPMSFRATTLLPHYFAKNELDNDCMTFSEGLNYERSVRNLNGQISIEQIAHAELGEPQGPRAEEIKGHTSRNIYECFSNTDIEIVKFDSSDKSQVAFESTVDANPDLDFKIGPQNFYKDALTQRRRLLSLIEKNPNEARYYFDLARVHHTTGMITSDFYLPAHLKKAKETVQKGLAINSNLSAGWSRAGRIELLSKDYRAATSSYIKAQALDPKSHWPYLLAGDISKEKNDNQRALAFYKLAEQYAKTPQDKYSIIFEQIEVLCEKREECGKHIGLADRIVELVPDNPWALHNISYYYHISGYLDKAIEMERKALSIMQFGVAKESLAYLLAEKALGNLTGMHDMNQRKPASRVEDAGKLLEEAYSLDADSEMVNRALYDYNMLMAGHSKDMAYVKRAEANMAVFIAKMDPQEARSYQVNFKSSVEEMKIKSP